jgi:thiol-disulfide isomerase/thioredoxin
MFLSTNIFFLMIRKLILFFSGAALLTGCGSKTTEISGILENSSPREYIFLQELKSNKLITVDSAILSTDGIFEFKRKVNFPSFYLLKINQNNYLTMLIEPGEKIKMTSHIDSLNYPVVVTGSKGTKLLADYNKTLLQTSKKLSTLSEVHQMNLGRPDFDKVIDSLDNLGQTYLNEMNRYAKKFIDDNIASLVSLIALYSQLAPSVYVLNPEYDLSYYSKVDSSLSKNYPEYEPVITLHNQVVDMKAYFENKKSASAGSGEKMEAPEIVLPSPEGDTIKLSSTRGLIVLLDFWAAWCGPCRMENPNLVKAYNKYHNQGFEIYQVSLDKTKEAWIKAIQDDRLGKWIHVSDLKYWSSTVVSLYKIESIPFNYLLDKEGRIIASNLRGEALQRKLAELFK